MLLRVIKIGNRWVGKTTGNEDVSEVAEEIETFIDEGTPVVLFINEGCETAYEAFTELASELNIEIEVV